MIAPATLCDLLHITSRLREWDWREIEATRFQATPESVALEAWACCPTAWTLRPAYLAEPVAAVGAKERWPGVWSVWVLGTDALPSVGLSLYRFVRRDMIPALRGSGARRADTWSMDGRKATQKWLVKLGARRSQEPLLNWGRNGETFWHFYWEP